MPNAPVFCLRLLGTVALELCDDAGQWRSVPLGKSKRAQLLAFVGISDVPVRRSEVQETLWTKDTREMNLKDLLRRVDEEGLPKLIFSADDSPEVPTGHLALNPIWKCDAAAVKRFNKRARKEDDAAKKRHLLERLVETYASGDGEFCVGLDEDDWVTEARAALKRDYDWALAELAGTRTTDNLGEAENVFVGREALVETVWGWATTQNTEWVLCLHGPGGVGKTRLAREAGRSLRGEFERICLVNLESQSPETVTPALVASAMAQELGLSEGLKEPDKELAARLKALNQRVLLILDNFESADTVATQTWLKDFALTGIKCLVTSRKRWTVRNAARNVEVERLAVPASATENFDDLPSVQLFRARLASEVALAAYPQLPPDDQEALVRILQVTEGFPLAIEIVAANLLYWDGTLASLASDLGVKKLAYRHDLDESGGGAERHESMGACFQWSLNLLPDDERARFPKLGVFPYDFSPEAAQEICGVSPEDLQRWWQRSLVQKDTTPNSTRRFLLSLLREYAQDQQSETVRGEAENRFVSYYARLVESCIWDGRLQINDDTVRSRLDAEWRTILAAQPVALVQGRLRVFEHLTALSHFLDIRGLWLEWVAMLETARDAIRELQTIIYQDADEELERYLQHFEGQTLGNLGSVYLQQGHLENAIACHQQSSEIFHTLNNLYSESLSIMNLGNAYCQKGHFKDAFQCYQQSLKIFRALNEHHEEGQTLMNIGSMYLQQGNLDDAIVYFQQSLTIFRALGDRHGEGLTLMNFGNVLQQKGQFQEAFEAQSHVVQLMQQLGDVIELGKALANRALILTEMTMLPEALQDAQQAIRILEQTQDRMTLEQVRETLAQIEAALASSSGSSG